MFRMPQKTHYPPPVKVFLFQVLVIIYTSANCLGASVYVTSDGHELPGWQFVLVHPLDNQEFNSFQPCLLCQRQHPGFPVLSSPSAVSEWAPFEEGRARNQRTSVHLKMNWHKPPNQ